MYADDTVIYMAAHFVNRATEHLRLMLKLDIKLGIFTPPHFTGKVQSFSIPSRPHNIRKASLQNSRNLVSSYSEDLSLV